MPSNTPQRSDIWWLVLFARTKNKMKTKKDKTNEGTHNYSVAIAIRNWETIQLMLGLLGAFRTHSAHVEPGFWSKQLRHDAILNHGQAIRVLPMF